ncbi:MAG: indole-3-glycerol-phosphate synthase [Acidimicrobiia bacterium]
MSDFLAEMSGASSLRARAAREGAKVTGLASRVASAPSPVPLQLPASGFDVIAEAKLSSPSRGQLVGGDPGTDEVVALALGFTAMGAAALSILTEPTRFSGSLEHLEAVSSATEAPVMRKDFLVDPVQVLEARAAGASGVLLIARMLPGELLVEMTEQTLDLGMFALVEVFDRSDLEGAVRVFGREVLVGVNCRDLVTLQVDTTRFETIAPHLPNHLPAVAESGISTEAEVAAVAAAGYRMALVGSSLVWGQDPFGKLAALIGAGRDALAGVS